MHGHPIKPLSLSPEEADEVLALIDQEVEKENLEPDTAIQKATLALAPLDEKLKKLTRCLIDEVIDEDSYKSAKAELVLEKTRLRAEKDDLHRNKVSSWIEPSKNLVNDLKIAGRPETATNLPELSKLVQKIGTNPHNSRKTVSFPFSEDYGYLPSILDSVRVGHPEPASSPKGDNRRSSKWCARRELNPQPTASEAATLSN